MRGLAAGLGVMLVDDGGADGEGGGGSVCNSVELQLVRTLRRGRCSGVAAAAGGTTRLGVARLCHFFRAIMPFFMLLLCYFYATIMLLLCQIMPNYARLC